MTKACSFRRSVRRAIVALRGLRRLVAVTFPDAVRLCRDPGLAERMTSFPDDHAAAAAICAIDALLAALDDLFDPLRPAPPPPLSDLQDNNPIF